MSRKEMGSDFLGVTLTNFTHHEGHEGHEERIKEFWVFIYPFWDT